jgi:shikimate dehydrogenase
VTGPASTVAGGAARFLAAELGDLPISTHGPGPVRVAAIGTTAATAVRGKLLAEAIAARHFILDAATAWATPDELFADQGWQLGVVLSPWKQQLGVRCDTLAPSSRLTGVVDSVLRSPSGVIGFNTNTWAAMSALEVLTGGAAPERLLLLGAGASARSVALAVGRRWPGCELYVAARRPEAAHALIAEHGGRVAGGIAPEGGWPVVVNTTSWGETEDSEKGEFGVDLEGVFVPGARLFDLNNRISTLQHRALAAGCAVISGAVMQRVTNASRAALLAYAAIL